MDEQSLVPLIAQTRLSSVITQDSQASARQHLFDGNAETCWTSSQGAPQYIDVRFTRPVHLNKVLVQFQGGFAGKTTRLMDRSQVEATTAAKEICVLHFDDNNRRQTAELPVECREGEYSRVALVFPGSTDFYGRVVVYTLDLIGRPADTADASHAADAPSDGTPSAEAGAHLVIS
ncbi:hypothetical protein IW150_005405 [Coemansia sp. RSA 2607]|nr:hypothetical protein IW150_005405 [Coemansia sp. RSA 2607]